MAAAITAVYQRWDYADKVREALERLGAWIEETAGQAQAPGGVVQFTPATGAGGGR